MSEQNETLDQLLAGARETGRTMGVDSIVAAFEGLSITLA